MSSGSGFAKQLLGGMLGKNKAAAASTNQATGGDESEQSKKKQGDIHKAVQVAVRNILEEMGQRAGWDAQRSGSTGRSDTLDFG